MSPAANRPSASELAAYLAAVEAGSIQGAAAELSLTQSAVTKRIQTLERRLGGPLLERGRFGVRPTELGRIASGPARRALEALDAVERACELARQEGAGDLRLSASHTIGQFLLPAWVAEFRREHPRVHPQLEIVNSRGVLEAIAARRSEIGFVEGLDRLRGLESLTVARDELVAVVAAGHRWASRRSLRAAELPQEPYLSREAASGTRAVAAAALAAVDVELRPALEAASAESLKRALASGGFTLMSRLAIEAEERAGTLVGITVRDADLRRELRAVRRRRAPDASDTARRFWRWLAASTRAAAA